MSVLGWLWKDVLGYEPGTDEHREAKRQVGHCEHIMREGDSQSRRDLKKFYESGGEYERTITITITGE